MSLAKYDMFEDRAVPLKDYIENKIEILSELLIFLTPEQKAYIRDLKSELEVDRFAHDLIIGKEGNYEH